MRKVLLSFIFAFLSIAALQAQDIITKRSGEKLEAKVLEVSTSEIKYKRFNNLEGPTYVVAKGEVMLIQYADKTTESFELPANDNLVASNATGVTPSANQPASVASEAPLQLYQKGQNDAQMYYDGYKPAGTGVLIASLVSPLIGLIPAIATSSSTPKMENLDAPNNQLLQQPDYANGYRKSARKIKSGKVWKNWAIGFGTNLVLVLLATSGS